MDNRFVDSGYSTTELAVENESGVFEKLYNLRNYPLYVPNW